MLFPGGVNLDVVGMYLMHLQASDFADTEAGGEREEVDGVVAVLGPDMRVEKFLYLVEGEDSSRCGSVGDRLHETGRVLLQVSTLAGFFEHDLHNLQALVYGSRSDAVITCHIEDPSVDFRGSEVGEFVFPPIWEGLDCSLFPGGSRGSRC